MRRQQKQLISSASVHNFGPEEVEVLQREDVPVKALFIAFEYFVSQNKLAQWSNLTSSDLANEANRCIDLVNKFKDKFISTQTYYRCLSSMLNRFELDSLVGTYEKRRICWGYTFASYLTKKNCPQNKELEPAYSSALTTYVNFLYNEIDSKCAITIIVDALEKHIDTWVLGHLLSQYPVLADDVKHNGLNSVLYYLIDKDIVRLFRPSQTVLSSLYDTENHCFKFTTSEFNQYFVRANDAFGHYVENRSWLANKELDKYPLLPRLANFCKKHKMRVEEYPKKDGVFGKWIKYELADKALLPKLQECSKILPMSFEVRTRAWSLAIQTEYSFYVKINYNEYDEISVGNTRHPEGWCTGRAQYTVSLTIFPDGNIFRNDNHGTRPLTVRELLSFSQRDNIFGCLIRELLSYYQERNLFVKDVVSDCSQYCFLPMLVSDLQEYHNKSEFITKKYKVASTINVNWNKRNLNVSYLIIKAWPKVMGGISRNILLQQSDVGLLPEDYRGTLNDRIVEFLTNVIVEKVCEQQRKASESGKSRSEAYKEELFAEVGNNFLDDEINTYINSRIMDNRYLIELRRMAHDYVNMCISSKQKVRLDVNSFQQAVNLHDEINTADNYYRLHTAPVKVPKYSKFNGLRKMLPDDFEWIKTRKRLIVETELQHHCVWSYAQKITDDFCAIYSFVDKKGQHTKDKKPKRYTIEFMIDDKGKYYIEQVQGKYDRVNTDVMYDFIQKILDEKQGKEK